jgi:hypothetical protein
VIGRTWYDVKQDEPASAPATASADATADASADATADATSASALDTAIADVASVPADVVKIPETVAPSSPSSPSALPALPQEAQTAPLAFAPPQPRPSQNGRYRIMSYAGIGARCERCDGRLGVSRVQIDGQEKLRCLDAKCIEAFIADLNQAQSVKLQHTEQTP